MEDTGTEQKQVAARATQSDISFRAVQVGRVLDRLRPGRYLIMLIKDEMDAKDWRVEVSREETLHRLSLPRRTYAAE